MKIKVVTDSTADLPSGLAEELGITVVPVYVKFGGEVYRDQVDISGDEFYQRLMCEPVHPSTEPPTPRDFADVYEKLSQEADGIISIHISSKISATCNSARRGAELVETEYPIQVVDSKSVTMGLGILVMTANTIAHSGQNLQQVTEQVERIIPHIRLLGLLDTLKYLARGGRIGRTRALLGSILAVKPMLTMKDGELESAGQVRKRIDGMERLSDFVKKAANIEDLSIVYSTTPDEARDLSERLESIFTKEKIKLVRLGPALGAHAGPGILFVALRTST
jgi:DegV family protein with EDD domain